MKRVFRSYQKLNSALGFAFCPKGIMFEEINRMVTDAISDMFFVTEEQGMANLKKEGKPDSSVHFVGHVMIDNLFYQVSKLDKIDPARLEHNTYKLTHPKYGVVTLHRPSNVDDKQTLEGIFNTLDQISQKLPLIFPIHPRTRKNMESFGIQPPENITLTPPLSYMEFLNLWKDATLTLTDSGGIQEETTALGIPCLTLRKNTERPITVTQGTNELVGTSEQKTLKAFDQIINNSWKTGQKPQFWDGHAAERIIDIIKQG